MTAALFDTHCHLDSPRFADDFEGVLDRARAAGVRRITTIGCASDLESAGSALAIAREHSDWVSATVGVHPHDAEHFSPELVKRMREHAVDPLVVAIGETGLDYYYDNAPREVQKTAFRETIALARELRKPLIVHTRDAASDTLEILREENARDVGGIIHCFSEDAPFAAAALDMGFVSSFSGIVTFRSAAAIQEAARIQPIDSILIETDAPYLAPIPKRGKRNEPSFVAHTAAFIAELRKIPVETLLEATYANACRVFGLESSQENSSATA